MMKKILLLATAFFTAQAMLADNKVATQEVIVNNQTVAKDVTKITFEGDNAVITFADNTQQTADMESVSINFLYDTTGLRNVKSDDASQQKVYNLKGQLVNNNTKGLKKGVYVVDGKKIIIK